MAQFFLRRPAFAWVLAILTVVAGLLALTRIPIAQYPAVAPPTVIIYADYPAPPRARWKIASRLSSNSRCTASRLLHLDSSSEPGAATVTLAFRQGTDPQLAQSMCATAWPGRAAAARDGAPRRRLRGPGQQQPFLYVSLVSDGNRLDETALGDFAAGAILPMLRRSPGIGKAEAYGSEYAMRIWFDPDKLNALGLNTEEVEAAIKARNGNVTPGQLGGRRPCRASPSRPPCGRRRRWPTPRPSAASSCAAAAPTAAPCCCATSPASRWPRPTTASAPRWTDARPPRSASSWPTAPMCCHLARGARGADAASAGFPDGVHYEISYDNAAFVQRSISRVLLTLVEAVVLVFLILYLFLGSCARR